MNITGIVTPSISLIQLRREGERRARVKVKDGERKSECLGRAK